MLVCYPGLPVVLQQIPQVGLDAGALHHLLDGAAQIPGREWLYAPVGFLVYIRGLVIDEPHDGVAGCADHHWCIAGV